MDKEKLVTTVFDILEDKLGIDREDINLESNLRDDLGMDSLDIVEVTMGFESEFDLSMDDEVVCEFTTVQQWVDHLVNEVS